MNFTGIGYHKNYSSATMVTEQGAAIKKETLLHRREAYSGK
jgi:hypothetical protein